MALVSLWEGGKRKKKERREGLELHSQPVGPVVTKVRMLGSTQALDGGAWRTLNL